MYLVFEILDILFSLEFLIKIYQSFFEFKITTRYEGFVFDGLMPVYEPFPNENTFRQYNKIGFLLDQLVIVIVVYYVYKTPHLDYHNNESAGFGDVIYPMGDNDEAGEENHEFEESEVKSDKYEKEPYNMKFERVYPPILDCNLNIRIETGHLTYLDQYILLDIKDINIGYKNENYHIIKKKSFPNIFINFSRESDPELLFIRYLSKRLKESKTYDNFNPSLIKLINKIIKKENYKLYPNYSKGFYSEFNFDSDYIINLYNENYSEFKYVIDLMNKVTIKRRFIFNHLYLTHLTFRRIDCSILTLLNPEFIDKLYIAIQIHDFNKNIKLITGEDIINIYLYFIKAYFVKNKAYITKIDLLYYIDKIKILYFLEKNKKKLEILKKLYKKNKYNIFKEKEYIFIIKQKIDTFEENQAKEVKEMSIFSSSNLILLKNHFKRNKIKLRNK